MTEQSWKFVSPWTPERTVEVKQRWEAGESAGEIGRAMNCTRSAVIGKVHRLGLNGRLYLRPKNGKKRAPVDSGQLKKRINRIRKAAGGRALRIIETITSDPFAVPPTEPINPTKLLDLAFGQCRWPCEGEGLETIFCGGEVVKGLSYCGGHCRMAYRGSPAPRTRGEYETEARKRRKVGLAA